jgi:hypothetical protein
MLTAAAADVVYRIKKEFCANKSSRLLSEEEKNNLKFKATTRHDKKKMCTNLYHQFIAVQMFSFDEQKCFVEHFCLYIV